MQLKTVRLADWRPIAVDCKRSNEGCPVHEWLLLQIRQQGSTVVVLVMQNSSRKKSFTRGSFDFDTREKWQDAEKVCRGNVRNRRLILSAPPFFFFKPILS